ncbi:MAG: NfeD family protein [Thainema sp.]
MSSFFEPQPNQWLREVDTSDLAVVITAISPHRPGRVYWRATYWSAQVADPNEQLYVYPETSVQVLGRRGTTLLVSAV